jgi:hypothetical protein
MYTDSAPPDRAALCWPWRTLEKVASGNVGLRHVQQFSREETRRTQHHLCRRGIEVFHWGCKLRGFDFILFFGISIGIKLRMIDISKKITFLFLLNV